MKILLHLIKYGLLISLVLVSIIGVSIAYYMTFQLPDTAALNTVQLQVPLQIFSRDGKLMMEYGEKRRIPLPYDQIPKPLINAVLATEDQRYFQHPGVDLSGLLRASVKLVLTGRKEEGGSTITMQVARSFYLSRQKTFGRKLREILLALKIDHQLSKQKILELYLNKIFLGTRAYGVEAASEVYYGKSLKELRLDQYAVLAGLPKAPSSLNPIANPVASKKRRDHVLSRMLELGYIDQKAYQVAIQAPIDASFHSVRTAVKAPYAADVVKQQLEAQYGDDIYTNGFKVYSTIDSRLQFDANQSVRNNLLTYDQRHGYRGAKKNLGLPSLKNMVLWEKQLSGMPCPDGLSMAAVMDMSAKSVTALRSNGSIVVIPWSGLSWARKQINENYLGRLPRKASDILKLGDVIYLMETKDGWRLAQIPQAESSLVALDPHNGAILALVGGFDYQSSQFNRVTSANRQPGSSFKPFIYSAAFDKGYTLATVINDAPIVMDNPSNDSVWRPQNDTRRFYGPTRLRDALTQSRNLVSIRLLEVIGLPYAIEYAKRFGFDTSSMITNGLSLALGTNSVSSIQLATAYAVFANGGYKVVPFIIDSIRNANNQVIYQAKPLATPSGNPLIQQTTAAPRVISAENAYLVTSALRDVIRRGTAVAALSLNRKDLAGKTGTTNNQVDAWFAGYNSDIVAVSWMGYDYIRSLHEYGNKAALPTWMEFMQLALAGKPEHSLEQPSGIVTVRIDPLTGKRAPANDPVGEFEYFMKPFVPADEEAVVNPANNPPSSTVTSQESPDNGVY